MADNKGTPPKADPVAPGSSQEPKMSLGKAILAGALGGITGASSQGSTDTSGTQTSYAGNVVDGLLTRRAEKREERKNKSSDGTKTYSPQSQTRNALAKRVGPSRIDTGDNEADVEVEAAIDKVAKGINEVNQATSAALKIVDNRVGAIETGLTKTIKRVDKLEATAKGHTKQLKDLMKKGVSTARAVPNTNAIPQRDERGRFIKTEPKDDNDNSNGSSPFDALDFLKRRGAKSGAKPGSWMKSAARGAGRVARTAGRALTMTPAGRVVGGILGAAVASNYLLDKAGIATGKGATVAERKARAARRQREYNGEESVEEAKSTDTEGNDVKDITTDLEFKTRGSITLEAEKDIDIKAKGKITLKAQEIIIDGKLTILGDRTSGGGASPDKPEARSSGDKPIVNNAPNRSTTQQTQYDDDVKKYGTQRSAELEDVRKNPLMGPLRSLGRALGIGGAIPNNVGGAPSRPDIVPGGSDDTGPVSKGARPKTGPGAHSLNGASRTSNQAVNSIPGATLTESWKGAPVNRGRVNAMDKTAHGAMVERVAKEAGMDPNVAKAMMSIESSGNARASTGSYSGLFQMSKEEMRRFGDGADPLDPEANAKAAMQSMKSKANIFSKQQGRPPTPTEMYLGHQQGEGGLKEHLKHPERAAWEAMFATGEGKNKGAGWAKKAIWDNIPTPMRKHFPGGVDSVTSAQMGAVWASELQGIPYEQALEGAKKGVYGSYGPDTQKKLQEQKPDATATEKPSPASSNGIDVIWDQNKRGYKNTGKMIITDPETSEKTEHAVVSGGRGKGSTPTGQHKIVGQMDGGSLGPRFRIADDNGDGTYDKEGIPSHGIAPSQRSAIRIHASAGRGTLGCIGVVGGKKVYADVYRRILKVQKANGGVTNIRVGTPEAIAIMNKMNKSHPDVNQKLTPDQNKDLKSIEPTQTPEGKSIWDNIPVPSSSDGKLVESGDGPSGSSIADAEGQGADKQNKLGEGLSTKDIDKTYTGPEAQGLEGSKTVSTLEQDKARKGMGLDFTDEQASGEIGPKNVTPIPTPPNLETNTDPEAGQKITDQIKSEATKGTPSTPSTSSTGPKEPEGKSDGPFKGARPIRNPTNDAEAQGPTPGSDGYGSGKSDPDGGCVLCAA